MKNVLSRHGRKMLFVMGALCLASLLGAVSQASARDGYRDRGDYRYNNRYPNGYSERYGYFDRYGNYHRYVYYNRHRTYWSQPDGIHFGINIR